MNLMKIVVKKKKKVNETFVDGKLCVKPTYSNPFMNANLITGNRHRPPVFIQRKSQKRC